VRSTGCNPPVVRVIELDQDLPTKEARAVMAVLARRTGENTVPRVFVNKRCIGGAAEMAEYAKIGALNAALRHAAQCAPLE
jgi:glutaredoxin